MSSQSLRIRNCPTSHKDSLCEVHCQATHTSRALKQESHFGSFRPANQVLGLETIICTHTGSSSASTTSHQVVHGRLISIGCDVVHPASTEPCIHLIESSDKCSGVTSRALCMAPIVPGVCCVSTHVASSKAVSAQSQKLSRCREGRDSSSVLLCCCLSIPTDCTLLVHMHRKPAAETPWLGSRTRSLAFPTRYPGRVTS